MVTKGNSVLERGTTVWFEEDEMLDMKITKVQVERGY